MGKRRRIKGSLAGLTVGLSAGLVAPPLAAGEPSPRPAVVQAADAKVRVPSKAALAKWLTRSAAWEKGFKPGTIYTWTTIEQLVELRGTGRLLTRSRNARGQQSRFDWLLKQHARLHKDPVSKLFGKHAGLQNRRFGWVNPWGAAMGWSAAGYGPRLLAVELKPTAWIGIFASKRGNKAWRFVDMRGRKVSARSVTAHPERLAAVYHLDRDPRAGVDPTLAAPGELSSANTSYREIVIVNESMVASWEHHTPAMIARLNTDAAMFEGLAAHLSKHTLAVERSYWQSTWHREIVDKAWAARPEARTLKRLYESGLALANWRYWMEREPLRAIAAKLRAATQGSKAISGKPSVEFQRGKP